jgi:hypothetical protein
MKSRPRSRRSSVAQIDCFTLMDELLASPSQPAAPDVHRFRISAAREAVVRMRTPETANITAWSLCCMVGNVLETMLQQGLVADPDGLLQDGFDALKRANQAARAPGDPVVLPAADWPVVEGMVEDWVAVLTEAPARDVIRAFRATDRRIRDIEAGRLQPHDYTVTTGAARELGIRL